MDAIVLDILESIASRDEFLVLKATIEAFKVMGSDDNTVKLFDHFSKHLMNGSFEIFPCTTDSNNDVVLSLGAFYFNSQQNGTSVLFSRYSMNTTSFYMCAQTCIFKINVYDQIREEIIRKLGDQTKTAVANY